MYMCSNYTGCIDDSGVAGVVTLVRKIDKLSSCTVAVDGSLYKEHPKFSQRYMYGYFFLCTDSENYCIAMYAHNYNYTSPTISRSGVQKLMNVVSCCHAMAIVGMSV